MDPGPFSGTGAESLAPRFARLRRAPARVADFARDTTRAAAAVARGFRGENISLRAAALTYVNILAIVPLVALGLAVASALGHDALRAAVREFVFATLAPGVREDTLQYLERFITRAGSGRLGTVGAAFLIASAVGLLMNIERSLNDIWAVPRQRPLGQRLAIYWVVLTLGPVLVGFSVIGTGTFAARLAYSAVPVSRLALTALPVAFSVVAFTLLYLLAPNAPVRLRSAFAGGIVGAAAWEVAKHAYTFFAARAIQYDAIYGALSAVPVFFLWVYVSWWVVLFGARLAYAVQHAVTAPTAAILRSPRARELVCARLLAAMAERFLAGEAPATGRGLSRSLGVAEVVAREAIGILESARLVAEVAGGGFVPGRAPESITLADLRQVVSGSTANLPWPAGDPVGLALAEAFARADESGDRVLGSVTIADLARRRVALLTP